MSTPQILGPDGVALPPSLRAAGQDLGRGYRGAAHGPWGGYYDAASRSDPDLAAWDPSNVSAQSALSLERDAIVSRIHDAVRNDGWASTAVQRQVDAVIGGGWRRSSKPNHTALGIEPEAAAELGRQIETQWKLYCEDFESCDAGQRMTMGGIMALAYRQRAQDGENLSLSLWLKRGTAWSTAIQMVSPDRLSNPTGSFDSVSRRSGVDVGIWNEPLGYHFRSAHPGDYGVLGAMPWRWDRFPRKYRNGRWCVVHDFDQVDAGTTRGLSPMAPVLKKLRMLGRYDHAELQAATLNALLAAFIKSDSDHDEIADALGSRRPGAIGGPKPGPDSDTLTAMEERRLGYYQENGISLPGVKLNFLYTGDSVELTKSQHPNTAFEGYYRTGLRYVAAANGVSYEQLSGDYSQGNYSSLRGSLLEVWRGFSARKAGFGCGFADPHHSNWLEEAIETGRVKLPKGAPRFRDARAAYCAGRWLGPPRGWVDPMKEADAAVARINAGISTLEMECSEQGHDWRDIVLQRAVERQFMLDNGIDPDALLRPKLPQQDQPGDGALPPPPGKPGQKPKPDPDDED